MAQAQEPSEQESTPANATDEIVVEEAPLDAPATATATLTDEKAESVFAGERVVYVAAPLPPKARSNRIIGSLLALLGAVLFALVYALVGALMISLSSSPVYQAAGFGAFIRDASFWVPVLFFAIGFVLVVLLLNRAAWWLHVLGSLLVAAIVYFGTIGVLLLLNGIGGTPVSFGVLAFSPFVLAATLVAREVSIWIGFLIAWRGVKVKALNKAEREAFEAEQAEKNPGTSADGSGSAPA